MKIDINQIPQEGLSLTEGIDASEVDIETDIIKFHTPIKADARVSKITNAVTVDLVLIGLMTTNCSRCLNEVKIDFRKNLRLNYRANNLEPIIDLNQDIREEIILDYPIKPLCKPGCKGLCPKCGKNLNEGKCSCD